MKQKGTNKKIKKEREGKFCENVLIQYYEKGRKERKREKEIICINKFVTKRKSNVSYYKMYCKIKFLIL